MGRRPARRMAAILAAGLVLAGCGGAEDDPVVEAGTEDTTGEAGVDHGGDDHGDEAGGAIGEPADASEASRTIEVDALDAMAFDPATIEVAAGEVVTFAVTNTGEAVHEFILGDAAMQEEHAAEMGDMGSEMAHDEPNALSIQPGETAELTWRFGEAGTLRYACHEPGHYEAGMVGEITVS